MSLLFVSPVKKEQKGTPFFAKLVTPEDIGLDSGGMAEPRSPVLPEAIPMPPKIGKTVPHSYSSEKPSVPSMPEKEGVQELKASVPRNGSPLIPQPGGEISSPPSEKAIIPPGTGGGLSFPLKIGDLFDREIIAKSAKKEDEQKKSSVTFDAKEFKYYGYMQRLKEKIEGIWQYPSDAAMRGIYGDLYINFTIKKDGSLGSVDLFRTSGYRSLDEAAIKALRDAAPYWPLPEEWKEDGLTIKGHFIYTLYGTYIR